VLLEVLVAVIHGLICCLLIVKPGVLCWT